MPTSTHFAVNPQTGERLALIDGKWVPATPAGQSSGAPKLTEAQAKDGFGAKRLVGAEQVIAPLEKQGYDYGLAQAQLGPLSMFGHKREYDQAANEWADSLLRMTSGAQATKQEIENTRKTYFPEFGDPPKVRQQKAAARARVERDALSRAGPAAMGGPPPTAPRAAPPSAPAGPRPKAAKQMSNAELKAALGL